VAKAARTRTAGEARALLSFIVVGGGASGVESLFALKRYLERHCGTHAPRLRAYLSFALLEAGPQILNGFPQAIVAGAMKELERNGVRVHVGEAVSCIEDHCVIRKEGERMPASLTIWAAGILPNVIPLSPEVHRDAHGCLITDQYLQLEPRIFAAGDAVTHQARTVTVPKNAQTAMRMSHTIVENAIRSLSGKSLLPFHYTARGSILVVGSKGFIDLRAFAIKTRFAALLRDLFYRYRHWQMTRK
ncbi:MAG: FAD-dependent oxidoreductase, partial [Patescibacteria group bacterium]